MTYIMPGHHGRRPAISVRRGGVVHVGSDQESGARDLIHGPDPPVVVA